jgi:hypothetical protein
MNEVGKLRYLPSVDAAALKQTLLQWRADFPDMGVCALLPEAEKDRLSILQSQCNALQVQLVGAIFPALVHNGAFLTHGVWLMRFDTMPYYELHTDLPNHQIAAENYMEVVTAQLARQLNDSTEATLLMLFDAMVPNIGTFLDGIYLHLANRVHYAGANAGSETFQPLACLFDAKRLVNNGMLLVLVPDHKGAILEHGYRAPAQTVYATSTQGNCISQIDWRPAFEVYQELVHAQSGIQITPENFYEQAVHFPFGIVRANHHVVVRIPVMLKDDGSLFCVGEVPANSVLTLLKSPTVDTSETLRVLTHGLQAMHGDTSNTELLLFYCAGRRMHLGVQKATDELGEFQDETRASTVAGALSLGELGGSTLHGYPLFHNATLVASRW